MHNRCLHAWWCIPVCAWTVAYCEINLHVYLGRCCPSFAVLCCWFSERGCGVDDGPLIGGKVFGLLSTLRAAFLCPSYGHILNRLSFSLLEVFMNERRWGLHTILCVAYNAHALGLSSYKFVYRVGLWCLHAVAWCGSWSSGFNLGFSAYFRCYAS